MAFLGENLTEVASTAAAAAGAAGAAAAATGDGSLWGGKLTAMLGLWLGSFLAGVLPQLLRATVAPPPQLQPAKELGFCARNEELLVSLLLCFGGGVLLFTTFIHLQPEVRDSFRDLESCGYLWESREGLPLAELVFCGGFFTVYLVEEMVHLLLDSRQDRKRRRRHQHQQSAECSAHDSGAIADFAAAAEDDEEEEADEAVLTRTMSLRCSRRGGRPARAVAGAGDGTVPPTPAPAAREPPSPLPVPLQLQLPPTAAASATAGSGSGSNVSTQGLIRTESAIGITDKQSSLLDAGVRVNSAFPFGPPAGLGAEGGGSMPPPGAAPGDGLPGTPGRRRTNSSCSLRWLFTIVALSFHAIFEGLAVGLEKGAGDMWILVSAVAMHKLVITFCVGVKLVAAETRGPLVVLYMAVFAAVTPFGVGLGLLLEQLGQGSVNTPAATILQAMAGGTLLYVVFFEVLQRERSSDNAGILQLAAIAFGFALMLLIQFCTSGAHAQHERPCNVTNHTHH
ncbi:uncharacterized protein LOC126291516 [Schistocerca gregaria]|uniref:uncharacterized protein LOC126291516 n=1 Tax=Schistocerca gregaria TaxID=7010 RepID=UPI00211E86B3|nr:uncharacterized protein LOC126291516 [Schistocerca gregaria]